MRRFLVLAVASVLLLAACGDDGEEPSAGDQDQTQEAAAATIEVSSSSHGDILVDSDGMTLYMFVPDEEAGEPTCYDDCAQTWPPLEATGEPTAGEGLDQSLLGTAERTDGTTQVTYNDLTLYTFSGDEAAGDTNGQGLNDVWWVVSADGSPVMD